MQILRCLCLFLLSGQLLAQAPYWKQLKPTTKPPARYCHAMAYDSTRKRVVLFGGYGSRTYYNDTWEWDGSNWSQVSTATSPRSLQWPSMAYDPIRKNIVLFGGRNPGGFYKETWIYDGSNWKKMILTTSPPARAESSMVYMPTTKTIILFGGLNGDHSKSMADTWEWNGSSWKQLQPTSSPPKRAGQRLVFNEVTGQAVLFGGVHPKPTFWAYDDTWAWNGKDWLQLKLSQYPQARSGYAMAYEPYSQKVFLFGGSYANGARLGDLWCWNGKIWSSLKMNPKPPTSDGSNMVYDQARKMIVHFGGDFGGRQSNQTWSYIDPKANIPPPVRYGKSTPACKGPQKIDVLALNYAGNTTFGFSCTSAPPSGGGMLALEPRGWKPGFFLLNITLYIDPTPSPALLLVPVGANNSGYSSITTGLPIGLKGYTFYSQYVWLNTLGCGGLGTLSCSDALEIKVF